MNEKEIIDKKVKIKLDLQKYLYILNRNKQNKFTELEINYFLELFKKQRLIKKLNNKI